MSKTVAIYSINFGGYRGEIKGGIDNKLKKYEKDIDYYFFTDNKDLKSKYWNIIIVPLQSELSFIDKYRHTSKYYKFVRPNILKKYDIVIFADSNIIPYFNKVTKEKLVNFMEKSKDIVFIKHGRRGNSHPTLEIWKSIRYSNEHKINGEIWSNKIKHMKFNSYIVQSGFIIHKNNKETSYLFNNIYKTLIKNGLRRDQNVIQYVLKENNFENDVSYLPNFESIKYIN